MTSLIDGLLEELFDALGEAPCVACGRPRAPTGVWRRWLCTPCTEEIPRHAAQVGRPPSSVRRAWALGPYVGPVGAHDDFFALGGDLLLGARLLAGVDAAFGVKLPLASLRGEAATVAAMAAAISAARAAGTVGSRKG